MRIFLVSILLIGLCSGPAGAADLVVSLLNKSGEGMTDAVVTFHPLNEDAVRPAASAEVHNVNQRNQTFQPFMTVVPKGTRVDFTNEDSVLHHVFSFSAVKRFSLKLFGQDETQSVIFDKPGVVVVGCNIHDDMIAYLKIVDTPFAAKTDASGRVDLTQVPDGPGVLRIWHPFMKTKNNEKRIDVVDTRSAKPIAVTARFRRGARPVGDY